MSDGMIVLVIVLSIIFVAPIFIILERGHIKEQEEDVEKPKKVGTYKKTIFCKKL